MKRKILITGATGFVGRHIVGALSSDETIELHLLVRDKSRAGRFVPGKAHIHAGDITDNRTLKAPLSGKEVVIHCAALMSNYDSEPKDKFREVNAVGTENLLGACDRGSLKQFMHISTVGVYGSTDAGPADESTPYGKTLSDYEWSKMLAEKALLKFAKEKGIPFTILRPSQLYGEGMRYGWPETIRSIKSGNMLIPGNGTARLHLLNIKDLTVALKKALFNDSAVNKIYNIAGPEILSLREIFDTISDILGVRHPARVPYGPVYVMSLLAGLVPGRVKAGRLKLLTPHRVRFFAQEHLYDISRARNELGYNPSVTVKDGVRNMVSWCDGEGLLR